MKKCILQFISTIICLSMLLFSVNAADISDNNVVIDESTILKPIDMVPNFLELSSEQTSKFVCRLPEYESTSNTIGFLNEDGTNTIFVFPYDIRYENEDGKMNLYDQTIVPITKDTILSTSLSPLSNYKYQNKSGDVKVYFNDYITDDNCVLIEKDDISISLKITDKSVSSKGIICKDNKSQHSMKYTNAFGKGTYVEYTPTDYGVKEDIILTSYNGDNTFEFELNTYGLIPQINEVEAILLKTKMRKLLE